MSGHCFSCRGFQVVYFAGGGYPTVGPCPYCIPEYMAVEATPPPGIYVPAEGLQLSCSAPHGKDE